MTINDSVMKALYSLGYRGNYNDRTLSHMKDELGVTNINEGYYKAGGIKSYVEGLIGGGSVVNYIARLDGVSQGWLLSAPIDITPQHKVRFKIFGGVNSDKTQLIAAGDTLSYIVHPNGNLYVKINNQNKGFTSVNGGDYELYPDYPEGNQESLLEVTFTESCQIQSLMYNYKGDSFDPNGTSYSAGAIYGFEVELDGAITHSILLTNKDQGATQQPTAGGVSATMRNYSEDVWEEL